MKKSELRNIIREAIKELIQEKTAFPVGTCELKPGVSVIHPAGTSPCPDSCNGPGGCGPNCRCMPTKKTWWGGSKRPEDTGSKDFEIGEDILKLEAASPSHICTNCGTFVGQTWKDGFKLNMASKFGPPGSTRLNQIVGGGGNAQPGPLSGKRLQAKNFLVKRKAALTAKQNNVNQSQQPEHYNQLQFKIDHITMIANNNFASTI